MNKRQSGPSGSRSRRPLTEFTKPAANIVVSEVPRSSQTTTVMRSHLTPQRDEEIMQYDAVQADAIGPAHGADAVDMAVASLLQAKRSNRTDLDKHDVDTILVKRGGEQPVDPSSSTPEKTTADFCIRSIDVMTANINATFDYAYRLGAVRTPSEFVALSASHAREQIELVVKHWATFRVLYQSSALTVTGRSNARATSAKNSLADIGS